MTDATAGSPSGRLVTSIRDAILRGELSAGQRLVEAELTDRFQATRGAVRQALVQLEGEGIVERERNRGARVRSVSLEQAVEITEVRAVLEGLCAAKAAAAMTDQEREELRALGPRLRDAVEAGDIVVYSSLAQEVHTRIRQLSRQPTASELLERLRYQSVRHHFSVALLPGRPRIGLQEHLDVLDAVTSESPERAEAVMRAHLESVVASLRQLGDRPEARRATLTSDTPG